jgi:hypothetical protein
MSLQDFLPLCVAGTFWPHRRGEGQNVQPHHRSSRQAET